MTDAPRIVPEPQLEPTMSAEDADRVELHALDRGIEEADSGATVDWLHVRATIDVMIARARRGP